MTRLSREIAICCGPLGHWVGNGSFCLFCKVSTNTRIVLVSLANGSSPDVHTMLTVRHVSLVLHEKKEAQHATPVLSRDPDALHMCVDQPHSLHYRFWGTPLAPEKLTCILCLNCTLVDPGPCFKSAFHIYHINQQNQHRENNFWCCILLG